MATINEALKKLFLGLGGDPDELKDNNTVSDYIDDLESAIETAASDASAELIDDEEASETKTYSSTKIESLIPENELPTPAVGDIGKVVSVVSDGESGAEYSLETPSGGENRTTYALTVQSFAGSTTVTFFEGYTRESLIEEFNIDGKLGKLLPLSLGFYYGNNDYSVMLNGHLSLTGDYINGSGKYVPVFSGFLVNTAGSQHDIYQVVFILGATSADDRFEVIPLTTT